MTYLASPFIAKVSMGVLQKFLGSAKVRAVALTTSVYWLLSRDKWMEMSPVDLERRIVDYGCYS